MKWNKQAESVEKETRHVLGISGGKDSAALAIYIKDHYPDISDKMEYFFADTGSELQEVYDTLDKLEAYLGKEIVRLSSGKPFEYWLKMHNNYLPSPKQRWCTRMMKIKPFEEFVGDDSVMSYIGIRADENREGYISKKESKMDATKAGSLNDGNSVATSREKNVPPNKTKIPEVQQGTDLSNKKNSKDVENSKALKTSVPRKGWWQGIIE